MGHLDSISKMRKLKADWLHDTCSVSLSEGGRFRSSTHFSSRLQVSPARALRLSVRDKHEEHRLAPGEACGVKSIRGKFQLSPYTFYVTSW